jgi:hypothetical protein
VAESDPVLRRVERDGTIACLAMTALAEALAPGRWAEPLGVLGGGLLVAVSYRGIKSGVEVLVAVMAGGAAGRKGIVSGLVKFFTRYAILAGAAYVIVARLRLPPVAVFAGASSIVLAVMVEALRGLRGR